MSRQSHIRSTLLAALLATLSPHGTNAQNWPTRPLTMVVAFSAGSASDVVGRILAARLSEILGQQVIVENVPGAGGMTGIARVAKAAPDGTMFAIGSVSEFAMNQTLYKRPAYNALTDFAPVGLVVEQPILLVTRKDLPARSLQEFVVYAKANQSKMQFGSSGIGSASHLPCAMINSAIGVNITHVPYRGSAPAMQDLIAGRIDYFCPLGAAASAPLQSQSIRALALLARERSPLFPGLATSYEQGLTGVTPYFWTGFFLPRGTPDLIVRRLHDATIQTLNTTGMPEKLKNVGVDIVAPDRRSSEYLKSFVASEIKSWERTIRESSVSLD